MATTSKHPTEVEVDDGPVSLGSISVVVGEAVTVWGSLESGPDTHPEGQCALRLEPDHPAIIGRAEGWEVPYLDPAYRPTTVLPGTGRTILNSGGSGRDTYVSRGHFMLRANAQGILLVNGVPRRGGGLRPPVNGTRMLLPATRGLGPGEEVVIEHGQFILLGLPNGSQVRIDAE